MATETPLSYVSFFLSLLGIGLFVLSGYQNDNNDDRHHFARDSDALVFNEATNITRLSRSSGHLCIGFSQEECEAEDYSKTRASLRVRGGIQVGGPGGPILTTSAGGRMLDMRGKDGTRVRVRLDSGGVLVGEGSAADVPVEGVRVTGKPVDSNADEYNTERWYAISGFDIASPDGAIFAHIHEVVHESGLRATRLSLPGASVKADESIHLSHLGVVIGDASWEFIDHGSRRARVLVTGQVYYENEDDTLALSAGCLPAPLGTVNASETQSTPELLLVEVASCTTTSLLSARSEKVSTTGFSGCADGRAYFHNQDARPLGQCHRYGGSFYILYCRI